MTQSELRQGLRRGNLTKLRHGWYASADADPQVVAAVSRGGVLSCVSALRAHGVWVPEHPRGVHARAKPSIMRSNPKNFCRQHWSPEPESGAVDDVPTALRHAVRCLDDEGIVVVCDSLLNSGMMTADQLQATLSRAPVRIRRLLDKCDATAQSGTETMARLRFRARGLRVRTQVHIPTIGIVDMLIGESLIFECDGRQYHADDEQFERDRERDRRAVAMGYSRIRGTYRQVVHRWDEVDADVMAIVRRGDHLRKPLI
ncbi:hypothetical protein GCM10027169_31850 [Gordonia jinhuaensis]|uniref:DUF559 domain-containing protein n=1 Tax=Gordonia jinhuaensis TaxID=1517702 RepID=A0A916T8B1_9ACTN|nr:hypothetical protein GCM10011489_22650 [Gordonia jinhuaensis]